MSLNPNHKILVRQNLRLGLEGERKRRRARTPDIATKRREAEGHHQEPTSYTPTEVLGSASDSDDLEDVNLEQSEEAASKSEATSDAENLPDSDEFDDLEDVDLDTMFAQAPSEEPKDAETLTFTITNRPEEITSKKRKFTPIAKPERLRRKLVHQLYLLAMVAHGIVRNRWCSDKELLRKLRLRIPHENSSLFEPKPDVLDFVNSQRFIRGLRQLAQFYSRKFKVCAQGLVRKDWSNALQKQENTLRDVTLPRFRTLVTGFRGSRDIGAQGFVALLRSVGVNARLVFSLQPPDYRSLAPAETAKDEPAQTKPRSEFDPVFIPDGKADLLKGLRSQSSTVEKKSKRASTFPLSPYPIFWIEAWNPYSRKWISIDPIVNELVEVVPTRRKCRFEAPMAEPTHQTWYVFAFDRLGGVKDVTRRYTLYYNAKTVKKRIAFNSDEDESWYLRMIRASSMKKYTQIDILESKEFHDRDIAEGVPNNMGDFKNHPVYALEAQLRQDEVIWPKDESSKCGTFRTKSSVVPIFKRSHVYRLRTPKAWHMRGRVLKIGAQPLKTKEKTLRDQDDDEDQIRLYAEFQTLLYRAPPIVDGKITKNAFGNVEIFTPTMMPDNGFLAKVTDKLPMKSLEKAARLLGIDYAKAIIAFDFGKAKAVTAKEGGILIDVQYKEAMLLVLQGLADEEEDNRRRKVELNALAAWKFFLSKLRIVDRLDRQHGKVSDDEEGYFSVASDESGSDEDGYKPRGTKTRESGGFVPVKSEESKGGFHYEEEFKQDDGGGFQHDDGGGFEVDDGGFLIEDGGGFNVEDEGGYVEEGGGFQQGGDFQTVENGGFQLEGEGGFLQEATENNPIILEDEGGFVAEDGEFFTDPQDETIFRGQPAELTEGHARDSSPELIESSSAQEESREATPEEEKEVEAEPPFEREDSIFNEPIEEGGFLPDKESSDEDWDGLPEALDQLPKEERDPEQEKDERASRDSTRQRSPSIEEISHLHDGIGIIRSTGMSENSVVSNSDVEEITPENFSGVPNRFLKETGGIMPFISNTRDANKASCMQILHSSNFDAQFLDGETQECEEVFLESEREKIEQEEEELGFEYDSE